MMDIILISDASRGKGYDFTMKTIESLLMTDRGMIQSIIVVEGDPKTSWDNKHEKFWPWIFEESRYIKIQTIRPEGKFNYNAYLNQAIVYCKSQYIALCNNDLLFEDYWAENIVIAMEKASKELKKDVFSASPYCPKTQGNIVGFIPQLYRVGYEVRRELSGWCIVVNQKIFDVIGQLNDKVEFWFSDNIYADQLRHKKLPHILATRSMVLHHESSTLKTLDQPSKTAMTTGQESKYEAEKAKLFPVTIPAEKPQPGQKEVSLKDNRFN